MDLGLAYDPDLHAAHGVVGSSSVSALPATQLEAKVGLGVGAVVGALVVVEVGVAAAVGLTVVAAAVGFPVVGLLDGLNV